jgi:ABC-2 type transport system permease protein
MMTILIKEINEFLDSLIGYVVMAVFLVGIGSVMWLFPETNVLAYGYATLDPVFSLGPYLFMFLIPAITMRSFAEEQRNGTIELLLTLPVRTWDIVFGKFLASWILAGLAILPTLFYYFTIYKLGNPAGNLDVSGIVGSYIGLFLLAGVFVSIGIFSSSITGNQIVSFVLSSFLCYAFYEGFQLISSLDLWGGWSFYLEQLGIMFHYKMMSKGLIEGRDLVYFIGVILIGLFASRLSIDLKRW